MFMIHNNSFILSLGLEKFSYNAINSLQCQKVYISCYTSSMMKQNGVEFKKRGGYRFNLLWATRGNN